LSRRSYRGPQRRGPLSIQSALLRREVMRKARSNLLCVSALLAAGTAPASAGPTLDFLLGDADCNGVINCYDRYAFVWALSDPIAYAEIYPAATVR
jgi:hypothetical protein